MSRRQRRRRSDFDEDDVASPRKRKPRFTCLVVFLYSVGLLLVLAVLWYLYVLLNPYTLIISRVLLAGLAVVAVVALLWMLITLYSQLQEALQKRDNRHRVILEKGQTIVTHQSPKQTRRFALLTEDSPPRSRPTPQEARLFALQPGRTPFFSEDDIPTPPYRTRPLFPCATRPIAAPLEHEQDPVPPPPPRPVYFASIRASIQPGHVLKGVDPQTKELRLGDWNDFKTLLILGSMASGKTNDIAEKTAEATQAGAELVICDPHASKPDSLYHRLLPFAGFLFPGTSFAVSHEDILSNVRLVGGELERRIQRGVYHRPLILVIDELNRLADDEEIAQELLFVLGKIGREGRDYHVYVIAGLHEVTYLAKLRKKFVSVIVHRVDESEAALLIPHRFAKLAPELPNGMTFVKDAYGVTERLLQPLITSRDIESIASNLSPRFTTQPRADIPAYGTLHFSQDRQGNTYHPIQTTAEHLNASTSRFQPRFEPSQARFAHPPVRLARLLPASETGVQTPQNTNRDRLNIPNELRQNIIRLRQQGKARRKIMRLLHLSGSKYQIIQRVLEEEGLQ